MFWSRYIAFYYSTNVISIVAAPLCCSYADKLVNDGNKKGYELVLVMCVVSTTIIFCCHAATELGMFDKSHNFLYFLFLRVAYSVTIAPAYPILDSIALNYLLDNGLDKSSFGHERLYGAYGWAIVNFILGICIDYFETRVMYVFITGLMLAVVYCLILFSKSRETPVLIVGENGVAEVGLEFMSLPLSECDESDHPQSSTRTQLPTEEVDSTSHSDGVLVAGAIGSDENSDDCQKSAVDKESGHSYAWFMNRFRSISNPNWIVLSMMLFAPVAVMFVVLHTVLAGVTSIVESLVFLFFKDSLGASNFIMGLSVVVTVVFEIPMFAYSKRLLDYFGQNNLLMIGCFAYCIRVIGYTLASNGIWVLIVEPLHGVTYASSKMSTVDFVSDVTPDHLQATAQGILSSLSAVGKLLGVSIGGYVEKKYGANIMYRCCAILTFVFLLIFIALVYFCPAEAIPPQSNTRRNRKSTNRVAIETMPSENLEGFDIGGMETVMNSEENRNYSSSAAEL